MIDSVKLVGLCETSLGIPLGPEAAGNLRELSRELDGDPAITDVRWRAYCLATILRECGPTFAPVAERGSAEYLAKYDAGTELGKRLGNTEPGDGTRFKGRGYVQITGRGNYAKFSPLTGYDLVANPDVALAPDVAYRIMSHGMVHGLFTGVGLARYINAAACDFVNARRIINGLDHAEEIAGHAEKFTAALEACAIGG